MEMVMKNNNFSENKTNLVIKFIDDYSIFIEPIEYKSPIYITIAYLCITNLKKEINIPQQQIDPFMEDRQYSADEYSDADDEFGIEPDEGDDEFGDEFGDDEDW